MTAVEPRCLHALPDPAEAESGNRDGARVRAAAMLRCSSQLTCSRAVPCSDEAMALLRRVLGESGQSK